MKELYVGNWRLEWAAEGRGLESESGDLHLVAPFLGGVLVANMDGLGHGTEAAHASREIAEALEEDPGMSLEELVAHCHQRAHGTRGAALTLASFDARRSTLKWCGIGNVEGRLFRLRGASGSTEELVQRGGVVGYQVPSVRVKSLNIHPGDVLVLATDGIHADFDREVVLQVSAEVIAQDIVERHASGSDDALVTVVRFLEKTA